MSFIKQQLKIAREAIAQKNFEYAQGLCETILENDPSNYNAAVFLGLACKEQSLVDQSRKAYETAIRISPSQALAYQGLLKLFESEKDQQGIYQVSGALGKIYLAAGDTRKYLDCLNRQLEIARSLELINETLGLLQEFLPGSDSYEKIKDLDIPDAFNVLTDCAKICEKKYYDTVDKEIQARRMRLGADPLPLIRLKVESEFILDAPLDSIYESTLQLDLNDSQIFDVCCKYLTFMTRKILHVPDSEKADMFGRILERAKLCLSKSFSSIACQLILENQDELLDERSPDIYGTFPKDDSYSNFVSAFDCWKVNDYIEGTALALEAVESNDSSIFGYQLLSEMYFAQGEWQSAIDSSEYLKKLVSEQFKNYGVHLERISAKAELLLGISYSNLGEAFSTKALSIFKGILQEDGENIPALIGLGKALLAISKYPEAKRCFQKVLLVDSQNESAKLEIGWTEFLLGNSSEAVRIFKDLIGTKETSMVHYRLAKTDKQYAHAHLIQAIKLDSSTSAPFTFLGLYYLELDNDLVRASKCFSKAISTDPKDETAVMNLVEIWLEQSKVKESVDLLLQYHTNSYSEAINYLQTALRIIPMDSICWISLGEAYAYEGKYVAALKALDRAIEIDTVSYTPYFFRGYVYQKLGNYLDAQKNYSIVIEKLQELGLHESRHSISTYKGMAENLILYAREQHENGAYGSCANLLLESTNICNTAFSIADTPFQCFGKLYADACLYIYRLVPELIQVDQVQSVIIGSEILLGHFSEKFKQFELNNFEPNGLLDQLLQSAAVGYQVSVVTCDSSKNAQLGNYFHDLGLVLYYRSTVSTDYSDQLLEASMKFLKIALKYSPDSVTSWNTLGVVAHNANPKISQHSFIRALELDSEFGMLWSNLGYFYYINGDLELAGQCFSKCQSVDPEFSLGWFGQALLAENLGSEDVFDLYEHSYELGKVVNFEILYNYARQCYISPGKFQSAIINGAFALLKCVEKKNMGPTMLNLYGLMLEQLGQPEQAVEIFRNALPGLEDNASARYMCLENLARNLCSLSKYEESVELFRAVVASSYSDAYSFVGYGIALFFNQLYSESMSAFQSALDLCDANSNSRLFIDISLYLTQVLFAIGTGDHVALAKQQLLQCFSSNPTSARPILNLCCLGVLLGDWELAQSSAAELIKIEPHHLDSIDYEIDFVLSRMFILQNDIATAKRFLAKAVHRYPWKAQRWARLSEFIYTHISPLSKVAITLSEGSVAISKAVQPNIHAELNSTVDNAELHRISGIALMCDGDQPAKSSRLLSKAIMMNPSDAKNWLALALEKENTQEFALSEKCANSARAIDADSDTAVWGALINANVQLQANPESIQDCVAICDNIASASNGTVQQVAYAILASALYKLNDISSCIQALKQSVAQTLVSNSWIYSLHLLGSIYLQNSFAAAAIECFKKAHEIDSNPASITLLAGALLQSGEINQANEIIMQASKQAPNSIGIKFIQTLTNFKFDAKQNKSRITKNKEFLKSCIDTKYYSWLESHLV
ncbi:Superkiller protein 3 [Boothiomyces sp. JEL0838]|nr:Superkiller protein 3 [Boothiomyces sp. JEL0838]